MSNASGERFLQRRPFGDETAVSLMHCGSVQTDLPMTTLCITVLQARRSLHACISEAKAVPWLPTFTAGTVSQIIRWGHTSRIGHYWVACGLVEVTTRFKVHLGLNTCAKIELWPNRYTTVKHLKSTLHCITVLLFFGATWIMYKSYNIALYITIRMHRIH